MSHVIISDDIYFTSCKWHHIITVVASCLRRPPPPARWPAPARGGRTWPRASSSWWCCCSSDHLETGDETNILMVTSYICWVSWPFSWFWSRSCWRWCSRRWWWRWRGWWGWSRSWGCTQSSGQLRKIIVANFSAKLFRKPIHQNKVAIISAVFHIFGCESSPISRNVRSSVR